MPLWESKLKVLAMAVVFADRGCNDCNYGRNNSGWGSGWGAVGGALVGGGFGAAVI